MQLTFITPSNIWPLRKRDLLPLLTVLALSLPFSALAEPWQSTANGLTLNANFVEAGSIKKVYLIVHGTWAHQGMEIIVALQDLLEEQALSSLAITLSMGVSDRSGFLGCDQTIQANHGLAVNEIAVWVNRLKEKGYSDITLLAHSRGAGQAALYNLEHPQSVNDLVLLAPMVWQQEKLVKAYNQRSKQALNSVLELARTTKKPLIGPFPLVSCDAVKASPRSFLSYYTNSPEKHSPDLIQQTEVPVQVYIASQDTVAIWSADDIQHAGSNTLVSLTTIEGAGHFFRDLYLDDVVEHMLENTK